MALYRDKENVKLGSGEAFDSVHNPGASTPHSGLYRCTGCGAEIASNANQPFPPQNHHQHQQSQGAIRWQLLVYAEGKK
jgi:hypothetical protein